MISQTLNSADVRAPHFPLMADNVEEDDFAPLVLPDARPRQVSSRTRSPPTSLPSRLMMSELSNLAIKEEIAEEISKNAKSQ